MVSREGAAATASCGESVTARHVVKIAATV